MMVAPHPIPDVRQHVVRRVAHFSGVRDHLDERLLSELFPDGWDFIELCRDLEVTFGFDLRPFFEEGQPERGWWLWRRKVARDATVDELANHIEGLVSRGA